MVRFIPLLRLHPHRRALNICGFFKVKTLVLFESASHVGFQHQSNIIISVLWILMIYSGSGSFPCYLNIQVLGNYKKYLIINQKEKYTNCLPFCISHRKKNYFQKFLRYYKFVFIIAGFGSEPNNSVSGFKTVCLP